MRIKTLKKAINLIYKYPLYVLIIAFILTTVSAYITIKYLKISGGYFDMISNEKKYKKGYINFTNEFGDTEMVYIVIQVKDNPEKAKKFADAINSELQKYKNEITKIFYKVDFREFGKNLLLYFDEEDIEIIGKVLLKNSSNIKLMSSLKNLNDLFTLINIKLTDSFKKNLGFIPDNKKIEELTKWFKFFKKINSPSFNSLINKSINSAVKEARKFEKDFSIFLSIINSIINNFNVSNPVFNIDNLLSSPEMNQLRKKSKEKGDGYLFTENKKLLLMMVLPKKDFTDLNNIETPLKIIREIINEQKKIFTGIEVGVTGRIVLQSDEMNSTGNDMRNVSIISLVLVTLLFIIFFRNLIRPLFATIALIVAIALTFGITTLIIGHLTIFSMVFTVILIGLGIDFGVHILSRYKAELDNSKNFEIAIEKTLLSAGKANVTTAIAISISFFAGLFSDFLGLQELGFIGGIGIIITFLSMLIILPSLLSLYDKNKKELKIKKSYVLRFKFFNYFIKYPKTVFYLTLILTLSLIYSISNIYFNKNVTELQAKGLESVEYEHLLFANSKFSSWFGAFIVNDINTVRKYENQLKKLDLVGEVHSILKVIPTNQNKKIELIKKIKNNFGSIKISESINELKKNEFNKTLKILIQNFELSNQMINIIDGNNSTYLKKILINIISKLKELYNYVINNENSEIILNQIQKSFFNSFKENINILIEGLNPTGINDQNLKKTLPPAVYERFISTKQKYVIYAYSYDDLLIGDRMDKFISQLQTVDKEVTGLAVLYGLNRAVIMKGFNKSVIFAFVVIFIIIFIDFRNFRDSLFAMVPVIFGIIWLLIIMGIFKLSFNFANFFSIPILIGIGIENGVQILHRFKEKGDFCIASKSTGSAVILTALTTIAGFGTLLIAQHRGVFSLGLIMSVGVFLNLIAGMILLPVILKLFYRKKNL